MQKPASIHATCGARFPAAASVPDNELQAARRDIETLRARVRTLKQHVALLELKVARTQRFANRDELTGLPNRRLLADRVDQAVARAARRGERVALLFFDLDGFKHINDSMGHGAGDTLLQQVAVRLTDCLRTTDTACRYGGDEFVVLLPEYENRTCFLAVARKLRARLAPHYLIGGSSIEVTVSMGMAVYPADGGGYGELIRVSDLAMYRDKSGRSRSSTPPRAHGIRLPASTPR